MDTQLLKINDFLKNNFEIINESFSIKKLHINKIRYTLFKLSLSHGINN